MDLKELTERWNRNLVQATHFADTDNLTDAVARARLVLAEIEQALGQTKSETEISALQITRTRAARAVARHESAYRAWNESVKARETAYVDQEHEAYDQPLPVRSTNSQ